MIPYCAEQERALLINSLRKREEKAKGRRHRHTHRALRRTRAARLEMFEERLNAYAEANMNLWDVR